MSESDRPEISAVLPVFNEEANLPFLHERLVRALESVGRRWEIIYVDDGSSDGTPLELDRFAARDPRVCVCHLRRNFGQTAALAAGFDGARGAIVVTLDADLQNPPEEIPALLAKLDEGYDIVSGWRRDRRDSTGRSFLSRVANGLIGVVTGVPLHDYGCTLKVYRRELLEQFRLYGELHRFLPALCVWAGGRIAEFEVAHAPRERGGSSYGSERILKVAIDLVTLRLLYRYGTKPAYVFGFGGFITLAVSLSLGLFAIFRVLFLGGIWISPLSVVAIVLFPLAIQFFLLGFIAEITVRTYYESQGKKIYATRGEWERNASARKTGA